MTALEELDRLLTETDRHAVLPREIPGPRQAVYRALRRRCDDRTLARIGRGIYARRRARLFNVVPEILPKLGYTILPRPKLTNYSFKSSGAVWRIDRPCTRLIVMHGVRAAFESPRGKLYRPRMPAVTPMSEPPSRSDVELHLSTFDRCHSYARAEKDLIVNKALRAWESFEHPDATLALDGGTCLSKYHRVTDRFSEDLDIRVLLRKEVENGPPERRIEVFRTVSAEFAEHVHRSLPFLKPTRKGRFRKRDGRFASHIFDYRGRLPHAEVVEGLKLELVQQPNRLPLVRREGLTGCTLRVLNPAEIAMGKWQALSTPWFSRRDTYPELIRHPWDLGTMETVLEASFNPPAKTLQELADERRAPQITEALRELFHPAWERNYSSYVDRMGTRPIDDQFPQYAYPTWPKVRRSMIRTALRMDVVPARNRPEVGRMAFATDELEQPHHGPKRPGRSHGRGR